MMKAHHSHSYPLLSALLFFFFVTWSSSGSLLSIWLHQEVGLKAGDTGIIYAVLSVSALFAQVCYGFIQDKLGLRKNLLWYITVLLILSGPAYLLFGYLLKINVLLGSIFGGIYIGLTFNGGIGVLESYTERVARQSQFEFGRARMWGSLGWAVATFLPDCCLTSTRNLTLRSPAVPAWCSLFCWRDCGSPPRRRPCRKRYPAAK
jgi:OHS family lactose permease-like MFS transporter